MGYGIRDDKYEILDWKFGTRNLEFFFRTPKVFNIEVPKMDRIF
jgi:hypothetical protein